MERKRILLLREAKQELWKKWRQKKGKCKPKISDLKNKTGNKEDELTRKLETIEDEVKRYEEELKIERELARTKKEKLEKKKRKEKHWEMLRWIVSFIEENKGQWEEEKEGIGNGEIDERERYGIEMRER